MSSFYGNMKNNSRASFIFDKIYPSRSAMEDALNAVEMKDGSPFAVGDGIFINRYVLVDYHYLLADDFTSENLLLNEYFTPVDNSNNDVVTASNYASFFIKSGNIYVPATGFSSSQLYYIKKVFTERYKAVLIDGDTMSINENLSNENYNFIEDPLYAAHKNEDLNRYKATYDCTVWMKIYADNRERYILVSELNAQAPVLDFINDAPSCQNGSGHMDQRISSDENYVYYMPKNWDMILNQYKPTEEYSNSYNGNDYYYYQTNLNFDETNWDRYKLTEDTSAAPGKDYYSYYSLIRCDDQHELELLETTTPIYYNENGSYIKHIPGNPILGLEYYTLSSTLSLVTWIEPNYRITGFLFYEKNPNKTFNSQVEYPYYNQKGFNKKILSKVSEKGQGIYFNPVPSAQQYPKHRFAHAGILTKDTYLPNKYYIYIGEKEEVYSYTNLSSDVAYYIGPTNPLSYSSYNNEFELISLILDNNGEYLFAKLPDRNQKIYKDRDLDNPNKFVKSSGEWKNNTAYYEITWALNLNGKKVIGHEDDTYRVDVYFPSLGNTISDMYDLIYGQPRIAEDKNDGYNNIIGYCSLEQLDNFISGKIIGYCSLSLLNEWTTDSNGRYLTDKNDNKYNLTNALLSNLSPVPDLSSGKIIPVFDLENTNNPYLANGKTFDLTDELFDSLSPEIMPGQYDIPVYAEEGTNMRPYDDAKLYDALVAPYDNIGDQEVSLGWMLTLLKQYLSELRYLSNGSGILADWRLDNSNGLGYINHRPNIVNAYLPTKDSVVTSGKTYYQATVNPVGDIEMNSVNSPSGNPSTKGYYELKLPIDSITTLGLTTDVYVRCAPSDDFDENLIYYMSNGYGGYVRASYTTYESTAELESITIDSDKDNVNLAVYTDLYIIIKDNNNNITKRIYKCKATHHAPGSDYADIGLYYGDTSNNTALGIPLLNFNIVIDVTSRGDLNLDGIADNIENINVLSNSSKKTTVLNYLNGTQNITGILSISDIEIIDSYNWPIISTEYINLYNLLNKFFYAKCITSQELHDLTQEVYNQDQTKYYTILLLEIDADAYEIYTIWASVPLS